MKFRVEQGVFDILGDACFGVVIAKGIDNQKSYPGVDMLLEEGLALSKARFLDKKVKEDALILPYREAFSALSINPNKFMSSIEALFTRISKGKDMPRINPIVDIGNAFSLKYVLPIGAHDIDQMDADIELRFSREGDTFVPFGETETENMPSGEPIYAVGNKVRTRRWIWRQSELGKITPSSKNIFFPIDGFSLLNKEAVLQACDALQKACTEIFGLSDVRVALVDEKNPEAKL